MNSINVNLNNLTESERKTLTDQLAKANKGTRLCDIKNGNTFKIGDIEFIKLADADGVTTAVTRDIVFRSEFGDNNDFSDSKILKKLNEEFLPKIADKIGIENICLIKTDLTTLDGLKPYPEMTSKVSLPTLGFFRAFVDIFDKYKVDNWWWLATPNSALPHEEPKWILCVSPSGYIHRNGVCNYYLGVRPFFRFVSSIFVSNGD